MTIAVHQTRQADGCRLVCYERCLNDFVGRPVKQKTQIQQPGQSALRTGLIVLRTEPFGLGQRLNPFAKRPSRGQRLCKGPVLSRSSRRSFAASGLPLCKVADPYRAFGLASPNKPAASLVRPCDSQYRRPAASSLRSMVSAGRRPARGRSPRGRPVHPILSIFHSVPSPSALHRFTTVPRQSAMQWAFAA